MRMLRAPVSAEREVVYPQLTSGMGHNQEVKVQKAGGSSENLSAQMILVY